MTTIDTINPYHEPEPTHLEGIAICGPAIGEDEGNLYEVTLTLQVNAASPEEASDRAMRFRDAIGCADDTTAALKKLDFWLHLHHPDGC